VPIRIAAKAIPAAWRRAPRNRVDGLRLAGDRGAATGGGRAEWRRRWRLTTAQFPKRFVRRPWLRLLLRRGRERRRRPLRIDRAQSNLSGCHRPSDRSYPLRCASTAGRSAGWWWSLLSDQSLPRA